jgi:pilus assembly protein CpaF
VRSGEHATVRSAERFTAAPEEPVGVPPNPLQPFLDDPDVEEVWVNEPGRVFVARGGRSELSTTTLGETQLRDLVEVMLRASGRRVDLSSPFVDATLADGSRLHVVIPPVTRAHWAVNIRKFIVRASTLGELVTLGTLTGECAEFLSAAVRAGLSVVAAGGTQAGKTTLLNTLANAIPPRARLITCEEVGELRVGLPDVVALQARQPNLEGEGEIRLRHLVKEALRMRPNRLIVGEVRAEECLDLLIALNSGLPGMTSVHANSAGHALDKLAFLPLLAGENVTHRFVQPAVASCIDLVVFVAQDGDGRRLVREVLGVHGPGADGRPVTRPVFLRHHGALVWAGNRPPRAADLAACGWEEGA